MKNILILSGLDPSGSAGLILDTKIIHHTTNFPVAIPTSLTNQTFLNSYSSITTPENYFRQTLNTIVNEINISAVKIGLIPYNIAKIVYEILKDKKLFVVWDPVYSASAGLKFYDKEKDFINTFSILKNIISLITPNKIELNILANNPKSLEGKIKKISNNKIAVLLKGGHFTPENNKIIDILYYAGTFYYFYNDFINKNLRGTGCVLSSAIASLYPKYENVILSYLHARNYLQRLIIVNQDIFRIFPDY